MQRACTRCSRQFTPGDLVRPYSKDMEAKRRAAGLTGLRFLYYSCPDCGIGDIFVDVLPLDGESPDEFCQRRQDMEAVVSRLRDGGGDGTVEAVVIEVRGAGD
jgi:hypothetical protein